MIKKTQRKNIWREILSTPSRFIAIFAITALGAGFYAGLKATGPDMRATGNYHFSQQQLMDVRLLSTLGFTDDDVAALRARSGIDVVMPSQGIDVLMSTEDGSVPVRLNTLPENTNADNPEYLNQIILTEGRFPESPTECIADSKAEILIGDTLSLASENTKETLDMLTTEKFTVVGLASSPEYISFQRGNATVGSGRTSYFLYLPPTSFDSELYTAVYLTLSGAQDMKFESDEYKTLVDENIESLETFGATRAQIRYDEITVEANTELNDARIKLADGRAEADEKLADALITIEDGETELADGRREIAQNIRKLDDAEKEIATGQTAFEDGRRQLQAGQAEYNDGLTAFLPQKQAWQNTAAQTDALAQGVSALPAALASLSTPPTTPEEVAHFNATANGVLQTSAAVAAMLHQGQQSTPASTLDSMVDTTKTLLLLTDYANVYTTLNTTLNAPLAPGYTFISLMTDTVAAAQAQLQQALPALDQAEAQLAAAKSTLDSGWYTLNTSEQTLADAREEIATGRKKLADARVEIADGEQELADGRAEYETKKAEADVELADAQLKIDDAQSKLDDLKNPEWFVLSRNANPGYSGLESDANRINAISIVIPPFFFLIAALVCLTTMTRMVEEQRTQIGTFKALGLSGSAIAFKYLFYAAVASITGGIAGVILGFAVFPAAIWNAYRMMYIMPPIQPAGNFLLAISTIAVSAFTTLISTLVACVGTLRSLPAQLMRPKAPRAGQRVLLERIPAIWSCMKFSQKVTLRNLFRYKKRFFMTIVGVAGCTALLVTGFGLRDSITGVVSTQYGTISFQNMQAALIDPSSSAENTTLNRTLSEMGTGLYVQETSIDAKSSRGDNTGMTTYLSVPENTEIVNNFINFHERKTGAPIAFPQGDGVIITEKLATRLDVKTGDTFALSRPNEKSVNVQVAGIMENYLFNYVYMPPTTYTSLFGQPPEYTTLFLQFSEDTTLTEDEALEALVSDKNVAGAMDTATLRGQMDDMLESLNSVIWLIILAAGLLAFLVLYNLTNINITERAREIATLKVLGFYPGEVASYVYRENILLTLIGALFGLVAGIFLHRFVIQAAEVDEVMFRRLVLPLSYLLSLVFTLLSSMLVNIVMLRKLHKVDMVESLKSAE